MLFLNISQKWFKVNLDKRKTYNVGATRLSYYKISVCMTKSFSIIFS